VLVVYSKTLQALLGNILLKSTKYVTNSAVFSSGLDLTGKMQLTSFYDSGWYGVMTHLSSS